MFYSGPARRGFIRWGAPIPGMCLYGNVVGGSPGQVISARDDRGVEFATTVVDANKQYGCETRFELPAIGGGHDGFFWATPYRQADTVYLYVDGVLVSPTVKFKFWSAVEVDLIYVDSVTLTVNLDEGGESGSIGTSTHKYNDRVRVYAVPKLGYAFDKWTGDVGNMDDSLAPDTYITMRADHTITATFIKLPDVRLYMSVDGDGFTEPPAGVSEHTNGAEVIVRAIANEGSEFKCWSCHPEDAIKDALSSETSVLMVGQAIHLLARFGLAPYKLQVVMEIPGEVSIGDVLENMPYPVISSSIV